MPSAGQLLRSRHRFAQMLPDRATIQRETLVPDGGGGQTSSWSTLEADVPCRLSPVGGGEVSTGSARRGGDRISDQSTSLITFEADTEVTEADRILVGSRTFDVTLVRVRGEWEMSRRVEAREV